MKLSVCIVLIVTALVMPFCTEASDRVHMIFTNNSNIPLNFTSFSMQCLNDQGTWSGCDGYCGCDENGNGPNFTIAPGTSNWDMCSFMMDNPYGYLQVSVSWTINGTSQAFAIEDPFFGSLDLVWAGQAQMQYSSYSLTNPSSDEYNMNFAYSPPPSPPQVMSLPVTSFSGAVQEGSCGWPNIQVLTPNGAVSVSGAGAYASGSTCTGAMSSCTFYLNAGMGNSGTAIVTDGTTNVPIQVSCSSAL